jgi:hypothetical protein
LLWQQFTFYEKEKLRLKTFFKSTRKVVMLKIIPASFILCVKPNTAKQQSQGKRVGMFRQSIMTP